MPTFSYSSGDPSHLTGGQNASMADIQGPLVDIRTFLNGGIGNSNLASNAGVLETQLATGSSGLAKGVFSVYRNAALSLASLGIVVFDTEEFDLSGWHDTSTGRYTPQVPGYYRLSWAVESGVGLTVDSHWQAILYKNGSLFKGGNRAMSRGAAAGLASVGSHIVVANGSTDFFDIRVFHNNGGTPALTTGLSATYFGGELVGRS